jgi:hypothetical protein
MSVQLSNYPTLVNYAILAYSGITATTTTTISNGRYGSYPTSSISSNITPTSLIDNTNAEIAQTQLTALVGAINTKISTLPTQNITPSSLNVFIPNINYVISGTTFPSGSAIVFDAKGNPNAQFFVKSASAITFESVASIILINGATNCNVFFLAGTAITFTGTSPLNIVGIFIAGSSITFANASNVQGRLYAQTENITFINISSVNALCNVNPTPLNPNLIPGLNPNIISTLDNLLSSSIPISNICFLKDAPIKTDQGIIKIKDINIKKHTINNKKILAVTKTMTLDNYLVCFDEDSLGKHYPTKQTIMSKNHKILFKGLMIEAHNFLNRCEKIYKINYNGEILYNILLDKHYQITVNNLICETLHPNNIIAQLYTNKKIKDKNNFINCLNASVVSNFNN